MQNEIIVIIIARNDNETLERCAFIILFLRQRLFRFINDTTFQSERLGEENYQMSFCVCNF